ncbi:hypothetical protein ACFP2T_13735 [Plantactinospora solaniradicis]|uniref:Uncharacterized protein n=1 Tax=Plantactinospora solaniradicis TaxID=1723736 RepID=A0ABW1K6P2_9ACTN
MLIPYLAAPALLLGYGLVRLLDGLDGSHGPGIAWTIGHLLFLAALVLFGVVMVGLTRVASRLRLARTVALVAGLIGLIAFVRVVVVDLIVGIQATDRAGMNRLYQRYEDFPGLPGGFTGVLDEFGAMLFPLGLLALAVLAATVRPRRLPWWSPVLAAVGFVLITVDLDLLPLGGAALLIALLPMTRQRPAPTGGPVTTRPGRPWCRSAR